MNYDLFRYKTHFFTCLLLFSYAYLHVQLTGLYIDVTLDQLINFSARLPFGQRVLVPALAHCLHYLLPIETSNLFFILELVFVSLLYFVMKQLLQQEFSCRTARGLTWLFLLILPLVTIVNYGFTANYVAPFYYPYDSAALFFMAAGFLLCLRSQWRLFTILIIFATLNRESSILLILLIPLLHWSRLREILKPFVVSLVIYLITRSLILFLAHPLPGELAEFHYHGRNISHFAANIYWLLNTHHLFLFIYCMAGLPLLWFTFYDYIPIKYQPIRYLSLFYFLGLLFVGNFPEARIFGEIVIILYLPVCVAISRWFNKEQVFVENKQGVLFYLNRYAILIVLLVILTGRQLIYIG